MKAKKIIIKGQVHDVGYRLFLLTEAESLFIENFDARNIVVDAERHLIVQVRGPEEKINRFVEFARSNYPPDASVLAVEVGDYTEEVRSIESFRQSFMAAQMAKLAQAGVGMLKQQDSMLGKQDETVNAIREESEKTRIVVSEEGEKTRAVIKKRFEEEVEGLKTEVTGIKMTLSKVKEKVGMVCLK